MNIFNAFWFVNLMDKVIKIVNTTANGLLAFW